MLAVLLRFMKNWTLPLAMLAGGIGYPVFIHLSFLTPYLIFYDVTADFLESPLRRSQVQTRTLLAVACPDRSRRSRLSAPETAEHFCGGKALLSVSSPPTATAAAVITDKLGGSAAEP